MVNETKRWHSEIRVGTVLSLLSHQTYIAAKLIQSSGVRSEMTDGKQPCFREFKVQGVKYTTLQAKRVWSAKSFQHSSCTFELNHFLLCVPCVSSILGTPLLYLTFPRYYAMLPLDARSFQFSFTIQIHFCIEDLVVDKQVVCIKYICYRHPVSKC